MNNELMRYSAGNEVVPLRDRRVAKRAKQVFDDVRLAALQADGAMALSAHMMEGLVALDQKRQSLSDGDPILAVLLMDIEANGIRQCKRIQSDLLSGWNI